VQCISLRQTQLINHFAGVGPEDGHPGRRGRVEADCDPALLLEVRHLRFDLGFGVRVSGFGVRVSGFGFRDSGFGVRGSGVEMEYVRALAPDEAGSYLRR